MKLFLIFGFSFLLGMSVLCRGQTRCEVSVPESVEAGHPDLSLADLLGPGACPAIVEAASAVRLGELPLAGSVRIFESDQIRILLEGVLRKLQADSPSNIAIHLPDRISVRRGSRLSCAEIGERAFPGASRNLECGSAGRIPREASLEIVRRIWDPATRTWELVVRCTRPGDCVPFLLRVPETDPAAAAKLRSRQPRIEPPLHRAKSTDTVGEEVLVHAGESATLVWEQDGIRVVVRAVCLEPGRAGEVVRARVAHTTHTLRAVVVARGQLRAQS